MKKTVRRIYRILNNTSLNPDKQAIKLLDELPEIPERDEAIPLIPIVFGVSDLDHDKGKIGNSIYSEIKERSEELERRDTNGLKDLDDRDIIINSLTGREREELIKNPGSRFSTRVRDIQRVLEKLRATLPFGKTLEKTGLYGIPFDISTTNDIRVILKRGKITDIGRWWGMGTTTDVRYSLRGDKRERTALLIIRDVSGSMSQNNRDRFAYEVVMSLLLLAYKLNLPVSLIDFNDNPSIYEVDNKRIIGRKDIGRLMLDLTPRACGGTKFYKALDLAMETLRDNNKASIIMITDGEDSWAERTYQILPEFQRRKITITGIGIGNEEFAVIKNLCERTSGIFFTVKPTREGEIKIIEVTRQQLRN